MNPIETSKSVEVGEPAGAPEFAEANCLAESSEPGAPSKPPILSVLRLPDEPGQPSQSESAELAKHQAQLVRILQMAFSGEKAAAYAYSAHWRSLRDPEERRQIQIIEQQELEHRTIVAQMLAFVGGRPQFEREIRMAAVGRTVGLACFLIGWFLPMYFAGRLEGQNIQEYAHAANHARALGLIDFEQELLRLSAVELEHEQYFRQVIQGHPLLPLMIRIFKWGA